MKECLLFGKKKSDMQESVAFCATVRYCKYDFEICVTDSFNSYLQVR